MRYWIFLIALLLTHPVPGQSTELFDQATTAYNEGDYQSAASKYEQILEGGEHSAEVYFNLGNSYYKMNKVGPSIYYYEKALMLAPGDQEILNNLTFARNMTLDDFTVSEEPVVSKFLKRIPAYYNADRWAIISIIMAALFVALFIAFRFLLTPFAKRITFISSIFFLLLCLSSIFLAYQQQQAYQDDQPAIIMAEAIKVRSEPNARGQYAFEIHEGSKVQVLEQLGGWGKIQASNGNTGWIPLDDVRLLKEF